MTNYEGMMRHVGMTTNTGKNVAVVFMTIPDDDQHCLVIDMDALPDIFQESIKKVIESNEGQQSENLGDVLGRRMSPDGTNTTILSRLHTAGRLQRVPIDLVMLVPKRNIRWPLKEVVAAMKANTASNLNDLDPDEKMVAEQAIKKFNPFENNTNALSAESSRAEAQNLINMAEMLERDAASRRAKAYMLCPDLEPAPSVSNMPLADVVKLDSSGLSQLPLPPTEPDPTDVTLAV